MKFAVFDIWGDFAHFRKYYTATSPLTFSFPTPTSVLGMIGAILGIDRNEYLKQLGGEKTKLAIQILSPVKKVRFGLNLINTKEKKFTLYRSKHHEPRIQVRAEFIKKPKYRIYLNHQDESIISSLESRLKSHRTFYTLSLGLSNLLADFQYVGTYESQEQRSDDFIEISSVIPVSKILDIKFENGKRYLKEEGVPVEMKQDRTVERREDILFEDRGQDIKAKVKSFYKVADRNIVLI
ncbi:MAG: type I-B CRISPR-associated protein Cas5b [Candidatus Calescibacterium sp.]|nr:type I-B CRISPR-associated protein Cas5b [Candidatus Calescibacterium sp.]MDW8087430.1 type I-B CRISPR-associated protein Cas5b [Candidatus Calescibacterium sp.]